MPITLPRGLECALSGLMLDVWADEFPAGKTQEFPVIIFNDLEKPWKGDVRFTLSQGGKLLFEKIIPTEVSGQGTTRFTFTTFIPEQAADYQIIATLLNTPSGTVRSLRDFSVLTPQQREAHRNLALGRPVKASSVLTNSSVFAVDGDRNSGWSSEKSNPQWLAVDLGEIQSTSRIELSVNWGFSAKSCSIQVSNDGENWKNVYTTDKGLGMFEIIRFAATQTRWVRLFFTEQDKGEGYSIYEFAVYH